MFNFILPRSQELTSCDESRSVMNIIEDLQWHRGLPQDAAPVWPSATALQQGAVQRLLWVPPLSRTAGAPRDDKVECVASIHLRVNDRSSAALGC
jgi:hypothetical protein